MKKGNFFSALVVMMFLAVSASAQDATTTSSGLRKQALGIRISSQDAAVSNSISYRYFFRPDVAVEGLFSFSDPVALGVLVEKFKPFGPTGLSWFSGGGAYAGFGGVRNFGLQGVVGLDFQATTIPINLSLDWKPELNITKEFSFEPAAVALSARFSF